MKVIRLVPFQNKERHLSIIIRLEGDVKWISKHVILNYSLHYTDRPHDIVIKFYLC